MACGHAQCFDVYGHKTDCPTAADSLTLYNNAIKVYQFYENSDKYKKTGSDQILDDYHKKSIFNDLATAKRLFFIIRRSVANLSAAEKKFAAGKTSSKYKDITYSQYYTEIDEHRFYQRELENQIVNAGAPMSMYDIRIAPVLLNKYICVDTTDSHSGDLVNIPLYVPVVVKPYLLLSDSEVVVRNRILRNMPQKIVGEKTVEKRAAIKRDTLISIAKKVEAKKDSVVNAVKAPAIKKDIVIPAVTQIAKVNIPINLIKKEWAAHEHDGSAVYAYTGWRAGAIVGFMYRRNFYPIRPSDYVKFATPKWAKEILANSAELKKLLKQKYGEYFNEIIE
jgi:hypothetical protein